MNIHPIFVHFPIALFTLYAVFEIARFPFLTRRREWTFAKGVLLVMGLLASIPTYLTGEMIEDTYGETVLSEVHSAWAIATIIIFIACAVIYAARFVISRYPNVTGAKYISVITRWFDRSWILVVLALCGLVAVTVTGALGGAMVYGQDVDPVVNIIYRLIIGA